MESLIEKALAILTAPTLYPKSHNMDNYPYNTKYSMGDIIAFQYDRENPNCREYVLIVEVIGTQYKLLSMNHGDIIYNDSKWVDTNPYISLT